MINLALALALLQEHEAPSTGLMSIQLNVMVWTLVIFGFLFYLLKKLAYPEILKRVEAREKALSDAIESAKRDREQAAQILADQKAQIDSARAEAQKLIVEARGVSEKMRADLLEKTRQDQQDLTERARREITAERDRAIAQLRKEAVDLAIAGASKVVEENLDSASNRKLVDSFLSSLATEKR
ncbi:MAG TPA: F0F1 ATP synthase subunit B [Gemmatimonadaceae bacterium]|nr:F0F1 ATP synthase subunit B [Gemmatimonadaceae bacterium]